VLRVRRSSIYLILVAFFLASGCQAPHRAAPGPGVAEEPAAAADDTVTEVTGIFLGDWVGARPGPYRGERKASREETARRHGHGPGKGILLKIETVSVEPSAVKTGGMVELIMTYAVLPPGGQPVVNVIERRLIDRRDNGMAGNPRVIVDRAGGTYRSSVPVALSLRAGSGPYRVIFIIEAAGTSDRREAAFTVE
jgi:hypothetical protein